MTPLDLRSSFVDPVPQGAVELRAFTHGLMPQSVPSMMAAFAEDWRQFGVDAWNRVPNHWLPDSGERVGWWTLPEYLGDRFIAPLVGAPEGTCILLPNVHWAIQCVLSSPEPFSASRRDVLLTEDAFPSVGHSAQRWAEMLGLSAQMLPPAPDGFLDREALLAGIGEQTALVCVSHVAFATGERLPNGFLRELSDRVHEAGGLLLVDGYHTTGSYPVDVQAIGADVYVGGLLKEASGSSGNAYVYVRPGLSLTPRVSGWFATADPFDFSLRHTPAPSVRRRFLGGTPAIASMYHAVEGARILLGAGLENVRADTLAKTEYCIARSDAAGLTVRSPRSAERRGAMVILDVPHADRLCAYLKTQGVLTDSRLGHLLRLAPFVWNTKDELGTAFDVIEHATRSGKYQSFIPTENGPVT